MSRPQRRLRVGVLLGERPDLLRALLDVAEIEVVAVARDRPEADAPAPADVCAALFRWWPERGPGARERREAGIAEWFLARDVDLVVAAGWLWLLTPQFLAVFADRIVNVHPTLLPAFPADAAEVRRRLAPLECRVLAETVSALAGGGPRAGR